MNVTRASQRGTPLGPRGFFMSILIVPFLVLVCVLCLATMAAWPLWLVVIYVYYMFKFSGEGA
jgi:uncharacterized protein (DUF983 family)